jgi:uncharacterized protein
MRFLIFLLFIYLGFRLFKKWTQPGKTDKMAEGRGNLQPVDDVMLKDPFCDTYFARMQGVEGIMDGKTYYFCSTACRDQFMAAAKGNKAS